MTTGANPPLVVLDDDPTGVQTLTGIRVLFEWDPERIHAALEGRPAVHLITNTRALPRERVQRSIEEASRATLAGVPGAQLALRGDSTLRGHLLEEYLGVRNATAPGGWPVLLLVPALPSAGRVTLGGIHFCEQGGVRTPLHLTEYAQDGGFAYRSARLLDWAEERSGRLFAAHAGRELALDELRHAGPDAVTAGLSELAGQTSPVAFAPDAETAADLTAIASGYWAAVGAGTPVIVRCSPAFAGILGGSTASEPTDLPAAGAGVLVVCGSYVSQSTRQLERLVAARPGTLVESDVAALADGRAEREIARLAREASRLLRSERVAVVATPRLRTEKLASLAAGERIALGLAQVVRSLETRPSVLVAKGGITSAVTLRDGVGADGAEVLGPVEPGVSLWAARWPDGEPLDYLVVPGNVGDDDLLKRIVGGITEGPCPC